LQSTDQKETAKVDETKVNKKKTKKPGRRSLEDPLTALRPEAKAFCEQYKDDTIGNLILHYAECNKPADTSEMSAAECLHLLGLSQAEAERYAAELGEEGWESDVVINHIKFWIDVYVNGTCDPCDLPPGAENADKDGNFIWVLDQGEKAEEEKDD
jgi:hypothetical protein